MNNPFLRYGGCNFGLKAKIRLSLTSWQGSNFFVFKDINKIPTPANSQKLALWIWFYGFDLLRSTVKNVGAFIKKIEEKSKYVCFDFFKNIINT